MRRRDFITLLGGATAEPFLSPLAALAQQPERMRQVGVVMGYTESDPNGHLQVEAFRQQLKKLGWVEGSNIKIDFRFAADNPERIRATARELLSLGPDVMVSNSNVVTTLLQSEVRTIPLVFVSVSDPIGSGFVTDWLGRLATSRGLQISNLRWAANGWTYSDRLPRKWKASGYSCIRNRPTSDI